MELRKYAALAMCIGAAGCSSNNDIETSEIANTSAELSGTLVREVGSSTEFLSSLTALQGAFDAAQAQVVVGVAGAPGAPGTPAPPPAPAAALRAAATSILAKIEPAPSARNPLLSAGRWLATAVVDPGTQTPADQAASELETFLRTRIFTEGNRESGNSHSATFRLRGSALCTDGTYPADAGCVTLFDDLELRIKATKAGGGFDFDFLVGPTRANPVSLGLRSGSASITFDLGEIKAAAEHIETVTGVTIDLPAVMEGAFRLAVNRLGQAHVSIVASVLSAIHVRVDGTGGSYDFTTQATSSLLGFEADASTPGAGVLSFNYGLGRTTISLPYADYQPGVTTSFTSFGIDLGGFSWAVTARQLLPNEVELSGLGLGSTQTRVWASDGTTTTDAVTIDLQDALGAPTTVDVTIADDGVNPSTIEVTPFSLSVYLGLGQLDLASPPPVGVVDDSYSIVVGDGTILAEPAPCDPLVATCPELEVAAGSLTISATDPSAVTTTVTVTATQCLFEDAALTGIAALSSGACP